MSSFSMWLTGYNAPAGPGNIENCYSTGSVSAGSGSSNIGGLVGDNDTGTVSDSFWDEDTSGLTTSDGGEGRTTTEMQDIDTFLTAGWDFDDTWYMPGGDSYPILVPGRKIYRVDDDATSGGDGSSWGTAFAKLQDALSAATLGDEVWVAQGTYKPDQGDGITPGDRYAAFQLKEGVSMYGGFYGNENSLEDRNSDITIYPSILSGDIDGDDSLDADNSYHVVTGAENSGLDRFTITMGFANVYNNNYPANDPRGIGAGMLNYSEADMPVSWIKDCKFIENFAIEGGGMGNYGVFPSVINCEFENNIAYNGAGIYNLLAVAIISECTFTGNETYYDGSIESSAPNRTTGLGGGVSSLMSGTRMTNCEFDTNYAGVNGGGVYEKNTYYTVVYESNFESNSSDGYGGAFGAEEADLQSGSIFVFSDCLFANNSAEASGGGLDNVQSSPFIQNCKFLGNTLNTTIASVGGGICNYNASQPLLFNCLFADNVAYHGGGMANISGSSVQQDIVNCTFSDNTATVYGGGLYTQGYDETVITNCIIQGNSTYDVVALSGSLIETSYSLYGVDTIATDDPYSTFSYGTDVYAGNPLFVDPDNGDYHLLATSGCIDRGTNAPFGEGATVFTDLDGFARVVDGDRDSAETVDMGAYEYVFDEPIIELSRTSLSFNVEVGLKETLTFKIRNKGVDTLNWQINYPVAGLTVSPTSGSVSSYTDNPYDYDEVRVTINAAGLSVQTISLNMPVVSDAYNGTQYVALTGEIVAARPPEYAADIYVPDDYSTIQAAINAASSGEVIKVRSGGGSDGVYYESNISFNGKNIKLVAEDCNVTIDAENNDRAFFFHNGETAAAILHGFRITNGNACDAEDSAGGGIYVKGASPTIQYCTITNCVALDGGGIALRNGNSIIVKYCEIAYNTAKPHNPTYNEVANGGGLWVENGGTITNCGIHDNFAYDGVADSLKASHEIYHSAGAATYNYNKVRGGLTIHSPFGFEGPRVYLYTGGYSYGVYGNYNTPY